MISDFVLQYKMEKGIFLYVPNGNFTFSGFINFLPLYIYLTLLRNKGVKYCTKNNGLRTCKFKERA